MAVAPEPLESFTDVFQGGSLTGNVLLEVPVATSTHCVLIGHAFLSFDDDDRAFFADERLRAHAPSEWRSRPETHSGPAFAGAGGGRGD